MITTETITINGAEYRRTYSDNGFMIERNNIRYTEAVDSSNSSHIYTETDEPIGDSATIFKMALKTLGVSVYEN